MAGKVRHLLNRSGRYFARLVVPADLRTVVGKTELRTSLGPDYRIALKLLPGAVADLQRQLAAAERKAAETGKRAVQPARYPMTPAQLAASHYTQRVVMDEELRNDPHYVTGYVDERVAAMLRRAIAGSISNAELQVLVGRQVEWFRAAGNVTAEPGSDEWRTIARALCVGEWEALSRSLERDEGDFTGKPDHPLIVTAEPVAETPAPVSLRKLWADYVAHRQSLGFMADGGRRQALAVESVCKHVGHTDAARMTKPDLRAWLEGAIKDVAPATLHKVYLPTIRSLFRWAAETDRLRSDPAADLRLAAPKKTQAREKGYVIAEAQKLLQFVQNYQPLSGPKGKVLEGPKMTAAKRFIPILCAHTGARATEIAQLTREDLREEEGAWIARLTPASGSTKSGTYRDVPLHPQLIELGFIDYAKSVPAGPLFHTATKPEAYHRSASKVANRVTDWLQEAKVVPENVAPLHGFRHAFKTTGRELGISDRTLDALQGHAPRTTGDDYGSVTIKTKVAAINRFPAYKLNHA